MATVEEVSNSDDEQQRQRQRLKSACTYHDHHQLGSLEDDLGGVVEESEGRGAEAQCHDREEGQQEVVLERHLLPDRLEAVGDRCVSSFSAHLEDDRSLRLGEEAIVEREDLAVFPFRQSNAHIGSCFPHLLGGWAVVAG